MAIAIPAKDIYQVAIQGAFGTPAAATAKLAVPAIVFKDTGSRIAPRIAKGLVLRNRGNEFVTTHGTDLEIKDAPFYYEQAQVWLANVVKGAVSPTGTDPYTWTYTRSLTANPALDALTIERRISSFAANIDMEVADVYGRSLTFKYAEGEDFRFDYNGFGRKSDDSSTLTAAQTMPTPEFVPAALVKVFIDSAYGSIGGTQITGQVIGMEWTFSGGAYPQFTADGRTALDYTVMLINPDEVTMSLKLTLLLDTAQYATEKAAAKAQSLRALRVSVAGSASRSLTLDGCFKYRTPDGPIEIAESNGQHTVVLDLEETTDDTNFFSAVLVNKTNAPDGVA